MGMKSKDVEYLINIKNNTFKIQNMYNNKEKIDIIIEILLNRMECCNCIFVTILNK